MRFYEVERIAQVFYSVKYFSDPGKLNHTALALLWQKFAAELSIDNGF